MSKNILFFANNPGGFRALLPVIAQTSNRIIYITEQLKQIIPDSFTYQIIPYDLNSDDINKKLTAENPDLVVLGTSVSTSLGGTLEKEFIHQCRAHKIKTLSVLDHWCHYSERYTLKEKRDSLPDIIAVMDTKAKKAMISEGFNESIIKITGQPAFDSLLIEAEKRKHFLETRHQFLPINKNETLITFVSEPVLEDYGSSRGYTQLEVLNEINKLVCNKKDIKLAIKTHPRESDDNYIKFLKENNHSFLSNHPPRDLVLSSDLVLGMTSILLIESAIMGIPTISFQPRLKAESIYAEMMQPILVCLDSKNLEEKLKQINQLNHLTFPYHEKKATQNILSLIRDLS